MQNADGNIEGHASEPLGVPGDPLVRQQGSDERDGEFGDGVSLGCAYDPAPNTSPATVAAASACMLSVACA